jgi:hypothetical protein
LFSPYYYTYLKSPTTIKKYHTESLSPTQGFELEEELEDEGVREGYRRRGRPARREWSERRVV